MKTFILLVLISIAIPSYTQISVLSLPEKKVDIYIYDSLKNIIQNGDYDYLKGQKIYYAVHSGHVKFYKISNGAETTINPDQMVGVYFNVVDVKRRNPSYELEDPLIIQPENTNDTIRYVGDWDDNKRWVVVGHYEKIKKLYEGKDLVFMDDDAGYSDYDGLININTQKRDHSIPKGSVWKCKSVSIFQEEDPYLKIKGSRLILILNNEDLGDYFCFYENSYLMHSINNYILGKFISTKDFEINKKNEQQRKSNLLKKYGKTNAEKILQGIVVTGWTKAMCIESWGEPQEINKTSGSPGVHEQWVYGGDNYLYFEDGVLTTIQN